MEPLALSNKSLTRVTIGNNVTNIGSEAFRFNQLSNLTFETLSSLTNIGLGAFKGNSLIEVTIPNNVTTIGIRAFGSNPITRVTSNITGAILTYNNFFSNNSINFISDNSIIELIISNAREQDYTDAGWTGFANEAVLNVPNFEITNNIEVILSTIKIVSLKNVKFQKYTIYNLSGAKVKTGIENAISTSFLTSGIYIAAFTFDKGRVIKKFAVR
ncbi:leucine-rich repeat protein [uncultured Algibacter sp.]|uniref:leucine-rich repeat protein n=1 Tax=uncultured Algibacter sp. TaxID=298659 RepID=UPI003216E246